MFISIRMQHHIAALAIVCLAAGCQGSSEDEHGASIDASLSAIDAAPPDAEVSTETCGTAQPPDQVLPRCGAASDCDPPQCWWCTQGPTGPTWTVAGDDRCLFEAVCANRQRLWREEIAEIARGCEEDTDCVIVGGLDTSCQTRPHLAEDCGGEAVNAEALAATDLAMDAESWTSMCGAQSCSSMVGPCAADCLGGIARCVSGTCTLERRSCLPLPPDAGP